MRQVTYTPRLTKAQADDLAAADRASDEAHRRWKEALEAADRAAAQAELAEMELVAAIAAYDLKRVQYGVKD